MSQTARDAARFHPQQARYFDQVNTELNLTPEELAMLERNGFLITDRLTFEQFKRAYAWIYWKDLPVLVTADAILHTIHQTYDELLKQVETTILTQKLIDVLSGARSQLHQAAQTAPDALKHIYDDLEVYLAVPLAMLNGNGGRSFIEELSEEHAARIKGWVAQMWQANSAYASFTSFKDGEMIHQEAPQVGIESVTFFGLAREVDFTQFRARGHYDQMIAYFCAMMWLQLIECL